MPDPSPLQISSFIKTVFDEFTAPQYNEQGREEFYKYIDPEAIQKRQTSNHHIIFSFDNELLVGLIEIRDYDHISMMFVKADHQRQGIGKQLMDQAIQYCKIHSPETKKLSVNSSPNSAQAYQNMGFKIISQEQEINGILFIQMEKHL